MIIFVMVVMLDALDGHKFTYIKQTIQDSAQRLKKKLPRMLRMTVTRSLLQKR